MLRRIGKQSGESVETESVLEKKRRRRWEGFAKENALRLE